MMGQRAFYSIDDEVLQRFNRLVPPSRRSKVIETMMTRHVSATESAITEAAVMIECDPSYRAVEEDAAMLAFENLTRLDTDQP
jgi:hypothetical protein